MRVFVSGMFKLMLYVAKDHNEEELVQVHCDSHDKNVWILWPITFVIDRPLPKNGWKMADGQLLFLILYIWRSLTELPNLNPLIFLQWIFGAQLSNLVSTNFASYMVV